ALYHDSCTRYGGAIILSRNFSRDDPILVGLLIFQNKRHLGPTFENTNIVINLSKRKSCHLGQFPQHSGEFFILSLERDLLHFIDFHLLEKESKVGLLFNLVDKFIKRS